MFERCAGPMPREYAKYLYPGVTGVADYVAHGGIDGPTFDAGSGDLESGFLRPVDRRTPASSHRW